MMMSVGFALAANGEPGVGVSAPEPESIEKTEILSVKLFVTSKYCPEGSTTMLFGLEPPAGVGVAASDKVPSLATLKVEIELAKEFATNRNFFDGSKANPVGVASRTAGVCAPKVRPPLTPSICSKSTEPVWGKVT